MNVACADIGGVDHQRKGFHTFVMTGDAIIRTNFNPFKPTRQLSLDSQPTPTKDKPKTERSLSNQETNQCNKNNSDTVVDDLPVTSPSAHPCIQTKEFIPGFMKVDENTTTEEPTQSLTEDSGIDVRLSSELDSDECHTNSQQTSQENSLHNDQQTVEQCEELHAIDEPSAKRLATRLYQLDGFKLSDVCYYLSKRSVKSEQLSPHYFISLACNSWIPSI